MIDLRLGDCLSLLTTLPYGCIDAIICDPPYPEISREYGRMTEAEWHEMMRGVVAQSRRVLKPTGSAVFILQPNSRKAGSMRPWLFEFQAWACREWNMVQDVWWWNTSALPVGGCNKCGLLRASIRACVWLGPEDCYRNQSSVLIAESVRNKHRRTNIEFTEKTSPSRVRSNTEGPLDDFRRMRTACESRGGVTPFNVLDFGSGGARGVLGHPASTPSQLTEWWTRYICPPGGTICDPFMGSGTTGLSALKYGCDYIGIEKMSKYYAVAERRIAVELDKTALFA
jgi:DNA modification methylase